MPPSGTATGSDGLARRQEAPEGVKAEAAGGKGVRRVEEAHGIKMKIPSHKIFAQLVGRVG